MRPKLPAWGWAPPRGSLPCLLPLKNPVLAQIWAQKDTSLSRAKSGGQSRGHRRVFYSGAFEVELHPHNRKASLAPIFSPSSPWFLYQPWSRSLQRNDRSHSHRNNGIFSQSNVHNWCEGIPLLRLLWGPPCVDFQVCTRSRRVSAKSIIS